ncbi:MAG TPA: hypothetical protein DIW17_04725 [Clostridiales bacterium]|nr:hypothetical protein [Clostridiales bacterium]
MKRLGLLLLSLLILAVPISVHAIPSPLSRVSSNVRIFEDSSIQVISYEAYIKVESHITKTTASLVLKNSSKEDKTNVTAGLPSHLLEGTIRVNEAEVYMDGVKQRLTTRRDRTRQNESSLTDFPRNWFTWRFDLEPEEYKVIEFSYINENPITEDGSNMVYLPFEYLEAWSDIPQNVQITLDFGNAAPYMFSPNPSVHPHNYDGKGSFTWRYNNSYPPASIQVYYRSIEQLAVEFLNTNDQSIKNITEAFANKSYNKVLELIDQYLETESAAPRENELLYLKALSHQGLYQINEAIELFDQLDDRPLFGEWEEIFKNRIIYDKYYHMQSIITDNADIYAYMDTAKNYVMGNTIFLMWITEELSTIEPPPTPVPTPSPTKAPSLEEKEPEPKKEEELITSVNIGGYEISVEVLFIGILAVIVILLILIFRKRKNRNRGYLFR